MIIFYRTNFVIEWHRNLKYWGNSIVIKKSERYNINEFKPCIRIFALFIWYQGLPSLQD